MNGGFLRDVFTWWMLVLVAKKKTQKALNGAEILRGGLDIYGDSVLHNVTGSLKVLM